MARAVRLHRRDRLDEAERLYRKILSSNPNHVDALHFLGLLKCHRGELEKGAQLIRRALERDPGYLDALNNLGNVCHRMGRLDEAVELYRKALRLDPANAGAWNNLCRASMETGHIEKAIDAGARSVGLEADNPVAWLNYGSALRRFHRLEDAVDAFRETLRRDPACLPAHAELSLCLYRLDQADPGQGAWRDQRITAYREWIEHDPEDPVPRYMLNVVTGQQVPQRAPDDYVRAYFDDFAGTFEENLEALDYRVPALVADRVSHHYEPGACLEVLDAGCGTGLCGASLGPVSRRLVGVDLSAGMLEQAGEKAVYDELVEEELVSYLRRHPNGFDLIVSADTLLYFGGLEEVLTAAAGALRPGGRLWFTLEQLAENETTDHRLTLSGRYAHAEAYVCSACSFSGLHIDAVDPVVLRREADREVPGWWVETRRAVDC